MPLLLLRDTALVYECPVLPGIRDSSRFQGTNLHLDESEWTLSSGAARMHEWTRVHACTDSTHGQHASACCSAAYELR